MLQPGCICCAVRQVSFNQLPRLLASRRHYSGLKRSQKHHSGRKHSQTEHWFETEFASWKSKTQLITSLLDQKVYEDENVLILNKPAGLPMHSPRYSEDSITNTPDSSDFSMSNILPDIKRNLESDILEIVYSQNRLYSGITVLAKNENAKEKLSKYFVHARTNKIDYQKYWAITVGSPQPSTCDKEMIHITRDTISGWRLAVLAKQESQRQRKLRNMINVEVSMKTLLTQKHSQHQVSIVELSPSTTKWDALQLFLLHKLSPALGDHMYSGRLKEILGRLVIHDHKKHLPAPQVLPFGLQDTLGLVYPDSTEVVPLHLHCRQLSVPLPHATRSHRSSETLTVTAPVPSFFLRTMEVCNLVSSDFEQ